MWLEWVCSVIKGKSKRLTRAKARQRSSGEVVSDARTQDRVPKAQLLIIEAGVAVVKIKPTKGFCVFLSLTIQKINAFNYL